MRILDFFHKLLCVKFIYLSLSFSVIAEDFVLEDIRVRGLQRLTHGTVFNYLPLEVGDIFTDQLSLEAVRSLFGTGFFNDVRLEREDNILIIIVKERPAIGSIVLTGNKDIKTDDIMENLEQIGFAVGRIFDQSQLDSLEKELQRVYFSQGKYRINIISTVTSLGNNRVSVAIDVSEGKAARIKQINIIGNRVFREADLLDLFELSGPTLLSYFTKDNQYSRQKLSADLETLQFHYQDNGYINFNVDTTLVTITPDKKDIYITINLTEGEQYIISGIKLSGDLIIPEESLTRLVSTIIRKNSLFSRKDVTDMSTTLTDMLGDEGYAFANVNPIPEINQEDKTVSITFFIDPGKRAYVRRVNFIGNDRTRDEVLRREMRQQESAWASAPRIERGKIRLQRLGYFEDVSVETHVVAGSADQVDVNYSVEEKAFGNFNAGLGYAQTYGLIIQTSVTQENFLGSGKRIQFAFNNSSYSRQLNLGYLNPYHTIDGIARGINLNYRQMQGLDFNVTNFDSRTYGGGVNFAVPIAENRYIQFGINYENTKLSANNLLSMEVRDFIDKEGNKFDVLRLSAGFTYDSLNKYIFPDSGIKQSVSAELSVPSWGNLLEFYKVNYRGQYFLPIYESIVFALKGDVGYGDGFGNLDRLPFFENYYVGGPRSVRGFEENTVGPRDSSGNPIGGFMKVVGGAELIFPIPFAEKATNSTRLSVFLDAGNVYGFDTAFDASGSPVLNADGTLQRKRQNFDLSSLRYSVGIGGTWISPFGVVSVSWSKPFNIEPITRNSSGRIIRGDEIKRFQFNFGGSF